MRRKLSCLILILFIGASSYGQSFKLYGKVVNQRLEPLAFATVEIRDIHVGTTTREDGSYELKLDGGKYDMVVTMLGYKPALLTVIVQKNTEQNVILEMDDSKALEEVRVRGKIRDRAEEIIRNVISGKEKILDAAGAYSCDAYIRATQEDSSSIIKKQKIKDTVAIANRELAQMAMAEVTLHVDYSASGKIKEERTGVKKRGNPQSLFYLSATEGDFNLYNNLIKVPAVSEIPFISPISYSGLIAYRYKTLGIEIKDGHKYYTIGIRPREMSNATVDGQVIVMDSAWVLTEANYSLPGYHLPEYDHFNIDQQYSFIKDTAWMISRQTFTYSSKWKKSKTSGSTMVVYKDFELNRSYPKNYFGTEISATAQEAYEKDSIYWAANRTEPLTDKELRFIRYKDSIYSATHSEAYLDSVDRVTNKVTWKNVLFFGQTFNDHKKERRWFIPPLPTLYQPIQFGGTNRLDDQLAWG